MRDDIIDERRCDIPFSGVEMHRRMEATMRMNSPAAIRILVELGLGVRATCSPSQ